MNLEDIEAELAILFSQMENQPADLHEVYEKIRKN